MRILVVEDDRRIAGFLERGLTAEGHRVAIELFHTEGSAHRVHQIVDVFAFEKALAYWQ